MNKLSTKTKGGMVEVYYHPYPEDRPNYSRLVAALPRCEVASMELPSGFQVFSDIRRHYDRLGVLGILSRNISFQELEAAYLEARGRFRK